MEKHNDLDCNCSHKYAHDLDHRNRSYGRRCSHECCCCCDCRCNQCRKNICDTRFKIRLAGLTEGLNYRLHQLLWCEVEIVLDNENRVNGTIVFVGSNFIEMLVENIVPVDPGEETPTESHGIVDDELTEIQVEENRNHRKGRSWIIPIDKIGTVELPSGHDVCKEGI